VKIIRIVSRVAMIAFMAASARVGVSRVSTASNTSSRDLHFGVMMGS
jgi:hypothetical protein